MASTTVFEEGKERMFSVELVDGPRYGSLYISDMHKLLCECIGLKMSEIVGLQQKVKDRDGLIKCFEVMVSSMDVWQRVGLDNIIGKTTVISYNRTIKVDRPYENLTYVVVKGVPMFWTKTKLEKLFNHYGRVKSLMKDTWNNKADSEQQFNGSWNGSYKVAMQVTKVIPSSLTVAGVRVEVHYRDQGISCWRCGMSHRRSECDTQYKDFINRFESFDEFNKDDETEMNASSTNDSTPGTKDKETESASKETVVEPTESASKETAIVEPTETESTPEPIASMEPEPESAAPKEKEPATSTLDKAMTVKEKMDVLNEITSTHEPESP